MHRRTFIIAAAALAACTPPAGDNPAPATSQDPAPIISELYDPYFAAPGTAFPSLEEQAPWSAAMLASLQSMMARSQARGEPILDFDPLIDAQDYQLANLNVVTEAMAENSHAVVRASFTNAGAPAEVVYDLVWENGAWRVDNIRTSRWNLRQITAE